MSAKVLGRFLSKNIYSKKVLEKLLDDFGDNEFKEKIKSGSENPNGNVTGNMGMLYRNTSTNQWYFCNGGDSWTLSEGSEPLSGTGSPNGSIIGEFGQLYYDTNSELWYTCSSNPSGNIWSLDSPSAIDSLQYVLYVDNSKSSSGANGSIKNPFQNIQDALDHIGSATSNEDNREVWTIFVAPGFYDENLTIQAGRLITIAALGHVVLGDGINDADNIYGSTTPRNITLQIDENQEFGDHPRPGLNLTGFSDFGDQSSSNHGFAFGGFDITGNLIVIELEGSSGTSHQIVLDGVRLQGDLDHTTITASNLDLQILNSWILGKINGTTRKIRLYSAINSRFCDDIILKYYSEISNCWFGTQTIWDPYNPAHGITFDASSGRGTFIKPSGFFNCDFEGTEANPMTFIGTIYMDATTNGALKAVNYDVSAATINIIDDMIAAS